MTQRLAWTAAVTAAGLAQSGEGPNAAGATPNAGQALASKYEYAMCMQACSQLACVNVSASVCSVFLSMHFVTDSLSTDWQIGKFIGVSGSVFLG